MGDRNEFLDLVPLVGTIDLRDEMKVLGAVLLEVQKFEFMFFGLAAHSPNDNNKDWNGKDYLMGNPDKFKETLGRLKKAYAGKFLIDNSDLDKLVRDRNTLCHNYYRMICIGDKKEHKIENRLKFLADLSALSNRYSSALMGFMTLCNNQSEYPEFSDAEVKNIAIYNEVAQLTLTELECKINKGNIELLTALRTNQVAEFIKQEKLTKLIELTHAHIDKKYSQRLSNQLFGSEYKEAFILLKSQIEKAYKRH